MCLAKYWECLAPPEPPPSPTVGFLPLEPPGPLVDLPMADLSIAEVVAAPSQLAGAALAPLSQQAANAGRSAAGDGLPSLYVQVTCGAAPDEGAAQRSLDAEPMDVSPVGAQVAL